LDIFISLIFHTYFSNIVKGVLMANKKGDRFECKACGLTVLVENPCRCEACNITCCGKPLKLI